MITTISSHPPHQSAPRLNRRVFFIMWRKLELIHLGHRQYCLKVYNFDKVKSEYPLTPANTFKGDFNKIMDILDEWKEHLTATGQPFIETRGY